MNYDTILYMNPLINEDERIYNTKERDPYYKSMSGQPVNWDDPKLYSQQSFGQSLQSQLSGMGKGYSVNVRDFGKWIVVDVTHSNLITARTASKTFLIVFQNKGDGIILNTANKYRTISGINQAISYIKSSCSVLSTATQSKL